MKSVIRIAALVCLAIFVSAVFPAGARPPGTENYNKNTAPKYGTCTGENSARHAIYFVGPEKLWPPNHKYVTGIQVVATSTVENEQITLVSTGTHNQYEDDTDLEKSGSGNTGDDITATNGDITLESHEDSDSGTPTVVSEEFGPSPVSIGWKVRAERSGRSPDGRIYTITGNAEYTGGGECHGTWTITVPHDMGSSNR